MRICRTQGTVHATVQDGAYTGRSLMVVQPLDLDGQPMGDELIAIDLAEAGPDDLVLVSKEGGGARLALDNPDSPAQALIVGVIDDVNLQGSDDE